MLYCLQKNCLCQKSVSFKKQMKNLHLGFNTHPPLPPNSHPKASPRPVRRLERPCVSNLGPLDTSGGRLCKRLLWAKVWSISPLFDDLAGKQWTSRQFFLSFWPRSLAQQLQLSCVFSKDQPRTRERASPTKKNLAGPEIWPSPLIMAAGIDRVERLSIPWCRARGLRVAKGVVLVTAEAAYSEDKAQPERSGGAIKLELYSLRTSNFSFRFGS